VEVEKTKPMLIWVIWSNVGDSNGLRSFCDFWRFCAARKQSQFKAKQSQYYLAPRFIWGLKNGFEKTKPIKTDLKKQSQFSGVNNWRKVLYERKL